MHDVLTMKRGLTKVVISSATAFKLVEESLAAKALKLELEMKR